MLPRNVDVRTNMAPVHSEYNIVDPHLSSPNSAKNAIIPNNYQSGLGDTLRVRKQGARRAEGSITLKESVYAHHPRWFLPHH